MVDFMFYSRLAGKAKFSDLVIPWATFTEPEVAHVGLYPRDMEAQKITYDTFTKEVNHSIIHPSHIDVFGYVHTDEFSGMCSPVVWPVGYHT